MTDAAAFLGGCVATWLVMTWREAGRRVRAANERAMKRSATSGDSDDGKGDVAA